MRIIVISTLTILLFFYPSIYLPMPPNQLEQFPHKEHQVDNEGRIYSSHNGFRIKSSAPFVRGKSEIKLSEYNCNQDLVPRKSENQIGFSISNNGWLIFQTSALAETVKVGGRNYCNDPDLNLKWEILVKKYPDDMGLHALHALRLGLCLKVGMNDISLDDALKIFEDVKKSFVEKKIDELLEDTNEQKKDM